MTENLVSEINRLHTTDMGVIRIRRNLKLAEEDVIEWCRKRIISEKSVIERKGKNWYVHAEDCIITVNAHSLTIITAHAKKN